jgi:hypothetical protein
LFDEKDSPVENWLNVPIPDRLWHYTSFNGFHGIVESKKIWATDVRFLNDKQEFLHARTIAEKVVDEIGPEQQNGLPAKEIFHSFISETFDYGALSPGKFQVFTVSFSASEDQLSQWRGYSQGSAGVSLGFDLRNFRSSALLGRLGSFAPCVYKEEKKVSLIRHLLQGYASEIALMHGEGTNEDQFAALLRKLREAYPDWSEDKAETELLATYDEWLENQASRAKARFTVDLLRLAAFLKHPSFFEENEWRLVLPVPTGSSPAFGSRKFRPTAAALVPYLEFPLSYGNEEPVKIVDLVLGPESEQFAGPDAASSFLSSEGINIVPRRSGISLRS